MLYRTIFLPFYLVTNTTFAAPRPYCDNVEPDPIVIKLERELEKSEGVTVAIREAQGRAYVAWDKRLNTAYRVLQSKLSGSARELLSQAQREWLKFREKDLQFLWSQSMLGGEGTLAPVVVADWSRDKLKHRVCELERTLRYVEAN